MTDTPYHARRVWDPVLRILHWWIAITVLLQIALGSVVLAEEPLGLAESGEEGLVTIHAIVGYVFGAGVLARILWLFLAPGSGSWRDILPVSAAQRRGLATTVAYYLRGFRGEPPFYRAHNPLAGVAYAGFFLIAASQAITGATLFTGGEAITETWETVHETGYWLIVIFIIAHLAMVAVHEIKDRRSLVSAMINGRKLFTPDELQAHPEAQSEEEIR